MDKQTLEGKCVAILATDGFEKSELEVPKKALEDAGARVDVVSLQGGKIKSWDRKNWSDAIDVDVALSEADSQDYDALVLPGGVMNPDALRVDKAALDFVKAFSASGKPIGAICHGPWTLIEDESFLLGKKMTSWPSLQTDLENAGAEWVDQEVVVDQGLVTSRKPDDLPAFNRCLIQAIHG
jgi:protease I